MEYYSEVKRNKLLIHTTIQMNLKNITPSQTTEYTVGFHLYEVLGKAQQICDLKIKILAAAVE